jgi:hypothetical protein
MPSRISDPCGSGRRHPSARRSDTLEITIVRPRRRNKPRTHRQPRLSTIRQRIERVFWTLNDLFSPERRGAGTLHNLRDQIGCRLHCLPTCVKLDHQLGRTTRSLASNTA